MLNAKFFQSTVRNQTGGWPTDGLVERWSFDDTLRGEVSGITFPQTVQYTGGLINKGYAILSGGISSNDSRIMDAINGTNPFTISFWLFNADVSKGNENYGNEPVVAGQYFGGSSADPSATLFKQTGTPSVSDIWVEFFDQGTRLPDILWHANGLVTNLWQHIVLVRENDTLFKFYLNNYTDIFSTKDLDPIVLNFNATDFYLGASSFFSRPATIDLCYVYNRALSAADVSILYNNGNGI